MDSKRLQNWLFAQHRFRAAATGSGGAPWHALTFDKEMGRVYIATGNAAPYDQQKRGLGDNLYTASIVALDAETGKYAWHYQINPADSWD